MTVSPLLFKNIFLVVGSIFFMVLQVQSLGAQSHEAIEKIEGIRNEMQELARKNQLSKVAGFYSSNAVINGFDGQYKGKEEIATYWKGIRGKGVDWHWEQLAYSGTDEFVTQAGISLLTLGYPERDRTFSSQFSVVWARQGDGSYKIASDFYRPYTETLRYELKVDSVFIPTPTDTLFGVLFSPKELKDSVLPGILCLQGGGDAGLENYFIEARFFAANGLRALVCDKAGTGLSTGTSSWVTQTFEAKTREYSYLLRWLSERTDVKRDKTGVHGLSEGGRLAVQLAHQYPEEVAFVNAVSAPLESFRENQLFAIHQLLVERNFDFSVINEAVDIWNNYFENIAHGEVSKSTVLRADSLRQHYPELYLPPNSTDLPQRPQADDINFSITDLEQITCPILFQYGDLDVRVNSTKSISMIPKRSGFTIINYQSTNHSMTGPQGKLNRHYLVDKSQWLHDNNLIR